jgi:hypothetical protein
MRRGVTTRSAARALAPQAGRSFFKEWWIQVYK